MFQFSLDQERRKLLTTKHAEYIQYFEDYNFCLTQRLGKLGRFEIGSKKGCM